MDLNQETEQATALLKGKVVAKIIRNRAKEVLIEFTDGTRLFVEHNPNAIELSVCDGESSATQV